MKILVVEDEIQLCDDDPISTKIGQGYCLEVTE